MDEKHDQRETIISRRRDRPRVLASLSPRRWFLLGVAAILILATAYLIVFKLVDAVVVAIPMRWEDRIGREISGNIVRTLTMRRYARYCRNPAGERALHRLTQRLAATVKTPYRFKVKVANTSMINAFAAPGGHILILRGLIDQAKSPDEVAGILAHEMGHVIERHATRNLVRVLGVSILWGGAAGNLIAYSGVHGRKAEFAADRLAVTMLNRAGIRSGPFSDFFLRMHAEGKGAGALNKYVGTHPPSRDRATAIRTMATGTQPSMPRADWLALKRICQR